MSKSKKKLPERSKPLEIRSQRPPPMRTPGLIELEYRAGVGYLWPEDTPPPGRWHVRTPLPCAECKHVYSHNATQSVICKAVRRSEGPSGVAYLECRDCGHRFKVPILLV